MNDLNRQFAKEKEKRGVKQQKAAENYVDMLVKMKGQEIVQKINKPGLVSSNSSQRPNPQERTVSPIRSP